MNTFIPYFLNILWENPKIIAQILINSELLDIKNCLSSFFMNNFFENVLSEYYIEDNLIIVLTLMLKNEINNLKNTRDFDNFLNFNSASRFLLSELRKKNDVKNFFKDILYDTIEILESKYSETIINIEINEIQNEITQKIQNQEVNNSNIYDKLNANNKNKIFKYN